MNRIATGKPSWICSASNWAASSLAAIDAALPVPARHRAAHGVQRTPGAVGDAARLQQVLANLLNNAGSSPAGGQVSVALAQAGAVVQITVALPGAASSRSSGAPVQPLPAAGREQHSAAMSWASACRSCVIWSSCMAARCAPAWAPSAAPTFGVAAQRGPAAVPTAGPADDGAPTARNPARRHDGAAGRRRSRRACRRRLLRDAGAEVLLAASAEEGLSLLRERHPAMMLSDIGTMPVADGYELIRRVRALPASRRRTPAAACYGQDRRRAAQRLPDAPVQAGGTGRALVARWCGWRTARATRRASRRPYSHQPPVLQWARALPQCLSAAAEQPMRYDDLQMLYQHLRRELDAAYAQQPREGRRIDHIATDLLQLERSLAKCPRRAGPVGRSAARWRRADKRSRRADAAHPPRRTKVETGSVHGARTAVRTGVKP